MPITLKDVPGISPHGGALEVRMAGQDTPIAELVEKAKSYPTIAATERRVLSDLELLAVGAVSPNRGFMTEADYTSVVNEMRLANGLPWSLPITLSATKEEAEGLKKGKEAAIVHEGRPIAIIEVDGQAVVAAVQPVAAPPQQHDRGEDDGDQPEQGADLHDAVMAHAVGEDAEGW